MRKTFYLTLLLFVSIIVIVSSSGRSLLNQNGNYLEISELKNELAMEGQGIYIMDYASPEMIWNFGDIIPQLPVNENGPVFPADSTFGILVNRVDDFDIESLSSAYSFELVQIYDLNYSSPDSRKHKRRLTNRFYRVRRR